MLKKAWDVTKKKWIKTVGGAQKKSADLLLTSNPGGTKPSRTIKKYLEEEKKRTKRLMR
jgi:hypothetical protein